MSDLQTSRYEILSRRAEGGFGRVLHARDKWLDREIAIKVLDPLLRAADEQDRQRFLNEARVLARLSHSSIPAIYDVIYLDAGEGSDPVFHIVFQYISGQTMAEYLEDSGPATLEQARRWFSQLASALAHAHEADVIHRDIKPDNIIIRRTDNTCFLVDWGIALSRDETARLTEEGYVVGTPGYMSPEQQRGEELDGRTDIWNLGVCLYELLSGQRFPIGSYVALSSINEAIPQAIDELIQDAVTERASRLGSISEFSLRLNQALAPKAGLTEVLTAGTFADLETSLTRMSPTEFSNRPAGQRQLIYAKVADIASSGQVRFEFAVANLLETLVELATEVPEDEYEEIEQLALDWAFVHQYGTTGDKGRASLRRVLAQVAPRLNSQLFKLVARSTLEFFKSHPLEDLEAWHLNGAREIVNGLMANRGCEDEARGLGLLRREIDAAQRGR